MGARKNGRARRRHARGDTPRVSPSRAPVLSFPQYFQAPATQASSYVYDDNRDDDDNDEHRYADVGSPRLLSMVLAFML